MTRWEAFSFISDTLRSMLLGRPLSAPEAENVSWDVVLQLASEHTVTPTLAWALRRADSIPAEVRDYLSTTLELNCRRNRNMLDGLELAVAALNSADCQPVLLKGGAALLDEGLYPDVSMRYLCDLDILVPLSHLHDAAIALKRIGFQAVPEPTVPKRWVRPLRLPLGHHLPPLLYGETGVVVELHRTITPQKFDSLLSATSGIEHQSKRKFRGLELSVLAPTDRIVHNIVHSQLHHGQHKRGAIDLRQLFELGLLTVKFGREIDWQDVESRFRGAGYLEVLQHHVELLQTIFSVPSVISTPRNPEVLGRLQSSVELTAPPITQGDTFTRVVSGYVYYFLRKPLLAANLMNPFWWPGRISAIRKRMRPDAPTWEG